MKAYFIAPLLALFMFVGYHWQAAGELRRRADQRQAALDAEHTAKLKAESEAQRQAVVAALAEQERRKKDRAEKEARDRAAQEARQAALDALDHARARQSELTRQLDHLQQDIAVEKKSVAELEAGKRAALSEQSFLQDFTVRANANVKALADVLDKLAAAQKAQLKPASP
jgi:hypothetical protein